MQAIIYLMPTYTDALYHYSGFPPYTEADCTDDCKKTNCQLCDYYYRSPTDDPVYICI